jgi:hypothetical protein
VPFARIVAVTELDLIHSGHYHEGESS